MKRVLLILTASRISPALVEEALAVAEKENAELVTVFILDTIEALEVHDRVSDEGFLGGAASGRLLRELRRERKRQGMLELADVSHLAEARGVLHRSDLVEGDFLTCALEAAQREAAEVIFVAKRERPAISRLVSGSEVEELKDAVTCKVMVREMNGD